MFSDFAYLDQAFTLILFAGFIVRRIYVTDSFRCVSWRSLKRVELKSIAALLLFLSLLIIIVYNLIAAVIKYSEGYWVDPATGLIITRPLEKYSSNNRKTFPSISVLLNLSWTLQSSALFLVMALWNHMSKAMLSTKFMSSVEFKAYAVYSIISLGLYPVLQVVYFISRNVIVSALIPLLIFVFQCLILVVLTQLSNSRFRKLIKRLPKNARAVNRVKYYTEMNNYLTIALFLCVVGLGAIVIDAVSTDALFFNKFFLDVLTKLFNIGFCFIYPISFLILFPGDRENPSVPEKDPVKENSTYFMVVPHQRPASSFFARDSQLQSPLANSLPASPKIAQRSSDGFFRESS